jgi:CRP-like cAMP-binding protein
MRVTDYYWEHRQLLKYLKEVPENTYLFKQGDLARTMFIIVRGIVELQAVKDKNNHIISLVEAGQFLGEKAILEETPYYRVFSAFARNRLTVLELCLEDMAEIQAVAPDIMPDLLKQMFLLAAHRLDRANALTHVLRSSNNVERVIRLFLFFSRFHGRPSPQGVEVFLPEDTVRYYIDITVSNLEDIITELEGNRLLLRASKDTFVIPNAKALLDFVSALSARIQSRHFDELEPIP